jgi:hypothetical protein
MVMSKGRMRYEFATLLLRPSREYRFSDVEIRLVPILRLVHVI